MKKYQKNLCTNPNINIYSLAFRKPAMMELNIIFKLFTFTVIFNILFNNIP